MSERSDAVRAYADNASMAEEFRTKLKALLDEHECMEEALEGEYEYAIRDNSPTSWNGEMYGVGTTEEKARYVATAHHDTVMRRRKAGKWEELK